MTAQVILTNMAIVAAGEIPALVGSLNVNSRLVSDWCQSVWRALYTLHPS